jgi:nucleotide-binding universal stress UspA family protein
LSLKVILLATDFSTRSDRALRRAAMLAKATGARIVVTHVIDDDQPEKLVSLERQTADTMLREIVGSRAELADIGVSHVVGSGEPFVGIASVALDTAADLIIVGSHRRQILRDVFVGTTAERVIRFGEIPVLMVNAEPHAPYARTVAAIDLSDCSKGAVIVADRFGMLEPGRTILLHVFDPAAKGMLSYAGVDAATIERYVSAEENDTKRAIEGFVASAGLDPRAYPVMLKEGRTATVIRETASEIPSLTVIGTNGRSGLLKVLLGSVAEEVLQKAEYDVLVVPPKAPLESAA